MQIVGNGDVVGEETPGVGLSKLLSYRAQMHTLTLENYRGQILWPRIGGTHVGIVFVIATPVLVG